MLGGWMIEELRVTNARLVRENNRRRGELASIKAKNVQALAEVAGDRKTRVWPTS